MMATEIELAITQEVNEKNPGGWTRTMLDRFRVNCRNAGIEPNHYVRNTYGVGYTYVDPSAPITPSRKRKMGQH